MRSHKNFTSEQVESTSGSRAKDLSKPVANDVLTSTLNQSVDRADAKTINRIEKFWKWFLKAEAKLFEIKIDSDGHIAEEYLDRILTLGEACSLINDDLSMEIESISEHSKALVISANGISNFFSLVNEIASKAPALRRWTIIKFRQRQRKMLPLQLKGRTVQPDEVNFGIGKTATGGFCINVFMEGFVAEDREIWQHLGFLFLDLTLGEFDVATKICSVNFTCNRAAPEMERITIEEFPRRFDLAFGQARH